MGLLNCTDLVYFPRCVELFRLPCSKPKKPVTRAITSAQWAEMSALRSSARSRFSCTMSLTDPSMSVILSEMLV